MKKLLRIELEGVKFGLWNDEIQSVRNDLIKHCLPYKNGNRCIAGTVWLDERFLSVADLSVCIGYSPVKGENRKILLLPRHGEVAGFVTLGGTEIVEIHPESVYRLPKYARTKVIDRCVVYNSELIPLINISVLHKLVHNIDFEPVAHELYIDGLKKEDVSTKKIIRCVECGGETFALQASDMEDIFTKPDHVATFGRAPVYFDGLVLFNQEVLPLIHLSRRIHPSKKGTANVVLVAYIGMQRIGFLLDADKGDLGDKVIIQSLPPLMQSRWMHDAIVRDNEIIPIIDLKTLILSKFDSSDETAFSERYKPDFDLKQLRKDVEVVELSILGIRYAIPKSEFVDSLEIRSLRRIPNISPVILGVAEYKNEVLPVLDLALCYGENSSISPEWKLVLVKNGNFRAFVVTENVIGARNLQTNLQRELPIKLPHQFVYGCYSDKHVDSVVLLLNIQNIAVHYNTDSGKGILKVLSEKLDQSKKEKIVLEQGQKKITLRDKVVAHKKVVTEKPHEKKLVEEKLAEEELAEEELAEEELAGEKVAEEKLVEEELVEEELVEEKLAEEKLAEEKLVEEKPAEEELAEEKLTEDELVEEKLAEEELAGDEPVEEKLAGDELAEEKLAEEKLAEEKLAEEKLAEEKLVEEKLAEEKLVEEKLAEEKLVEEKLAEEKLVEEKLAEEKLAEEKLVEEKLAEEKLAEEEVVEKKEVKEEEVKEKAKHPKTEVKSRKRKYIYIAIAAALFSMAVVYFFVPFKQNDIDKIEEIRDIGTVEEVREIDKVDEVGDIGTVEEVREIDNVDEVGDISKVEEVRVIDKVDEVGDIGTVEEVRLEESVKIRTKEAVETTKPTDQPPKLMFNYVDYIIIKGDHLWGITETFTGRGWDYPIIQKENKIPNADLIFPDQVLRIKVDKNKVK